MFCYSGGNYPISTLKIIKYFPVSLSRQQIVSILKLFKSVSQAIQSKAKSKLKITHLKNSDIDFSFKFIYLLGREKTTTKSEWKSQTERHVP